MCLFFSHSLLFVEFFIRRTGEQEAQGLEISYEAHPGSTEAEDLRVHGT
jgi:hypothetical protein